jgi:cytochrome c oxidase subunit III
MVVAVIFLVVIAVLVGWWLSRQGLTAKPWLEVGVSGDAHGTEPSVRPTAGIGLGAFLVVAGSLFSLLVSAYSMRKGMADWQSLPMPTVLWVSTGLLILSSISLQMAVTATRRGEHDAIRAGLLTAGVASLGFLGAQLLAWSELAASGRFTAADPATAFFYLLTAIHGLHVLGGLVALCRTTIKAFVLSEACTPRALGELTLSMKLCAVYWHFLLLVWLVLFSFLMRWVEDLVAICRGLLT